VSEPARKARLESVDAVRGLIMVVMALDHARDFLGVKAFMATDLTKTTVAYFLTRWVTHFCAPGFMLLAGTAAFLSQKAPAERTRFLLSRGLWLVFAELTFINVAWTFSLTAPGLMVIWALGWSMVALAALAHLPPRALAVVSVGTIALHNLLDGVKVGELSAQAPVGDWAWSVLHQKNAPVTYPLLPWVAVMALGYVLGPIFTWEPARRRRALWQLGLACTAGFVALRASNLYGDASPWVPQARGAFTALSFLNVTKYPPSLAYLLMTLGPLLWLLAAAERWPQALVRPLVVFGRVPFFYYVLHLFLLHALAVALGAAQGFDAQSFFAPFWKFPQGFGLELPEVYLAWALAVGALYLPSRWFAGVKARRRDAWLSYF
jgi:uncharacterized membrane protein